MKQNKKAKWIVGTAGVAFSAFVLSQFSPADSGTSQNQNQLQQSNPDSNEYSRQHPFRSFDNGSNDDQNSGSEWSFDNGQDQGQGGNGFDDGGGFNSDRQTGRS